MVFMSMCLANPGTDPAVYGRVRSFNSPGQHVIVAGPGEVE
jgi:hypothetical protein